MGSRGSQKSTGHGSTCRLDSLRCARGRRRQHLSKRRYKPPSISRTGREIAPLADMPGRNINTRSIRALPDSMKSPWSFMLFDETSRPRPGRTGIAGLRISTFLPCRAVSFAPSCRTRKTTGARLSVPPLFAAENRRSGTRPRAHLAKTDSKAAEVETARQAGVAAHLVGRRHRPVAGSLRLRTSRASSFPGEILVRMPRGINIRPG